MMGLHTWWGGLIFALLLWNWYVEFCLCLFVYLYIALRLFLCYAAACLWLLFIIFCLGFELRCACI